MFMCFQFFLACILKSLRWYTVIKLLTLFGLCILFNGCAAIQFVTVPWQPNFNNTPLGTKVVVVDHFHVKEPISGANLSAEWSATTMVSQAKANGLKDIYYMDKKVTSIFGIYVKTEYILHGD